MYAPASPTSSPSEMPLLMTAYEDSYHSYAASLADVHAQLADLAAREAAIKGCMDSAQQSFHALAAEMQQQEEAVQQHQRRSRERQLEVQERLTALQRRREHLATYRSQRQSLLAEDEAVAAQESYWQDLWKSHQRALDTLTRRRRGTSSPALMDTAAAAVDAAPHDMLSTGVATYSGRVPNPPPPPPPPPAQQQQQRMTEAAASPPTPSSSLLNRWSDVLAAVQSGHAATLATLLRSCPEAAAATDDEGNTLLHRACAVEPPSAAVLRCLLSRHDAASALHAHNAAGLTPFHVACLNRRDPTHVVVAALLAAGVSVDETTASGETAAHLLASHDAFLAALAFLVDHHGLDVTRQAHVAGQLLTPLGVAEYYGGAQTAGIRELLRALA